MYMTNHPLHEFFVIVTMYKSFGFLNDVCAQSLENSMVYQTLNQ